MYKISYKMSSSTFITAFIDIGISNYRIPENYVEYFTSLLEKVIKENNLVIYVEEHIATIIRPLLSKNHKLVVFEKKELKTFELLPLLSKIHENTFHFDTLQRDKFTPKYLCTIYSKFEFIEKTIKNNPFNSKYFGWIDFGIMHGAIPNQLSIIKSDKIRIELMNISKFESSIYNFSQIPCYVNAGYFTGNSEKMETLCNLFYQKRNMIIECGFAVSEEQILSILIVENYSIFFPYYGDYRHVLINYTKPCSDSILLVLDTFFYFISIGDKNRAKQVGDYIWLSCQEEEYEQEIYYFFINKYLKILEDDQSIIDQVKNCYNRFLNESYDFNILHHSHT